MADSPRTGRPLGLVTPIERRDFLNGLAIGAGLLATGCTLPAESATGAAPPTQGPAGYYPPTRVGMRGSHPGSFEGAHALRDGQPVAPASATGESYDLVVVGGGISGLSAAWFWRQARPNARILILDNHDDFGGHAKRNEFEVDGRTLLSNGGTMLIHSPRPYSPVADGLLKSLGIDPPALAKAGRGDSPLDRLGSATFFDKATFGADKLVMQPASEEPTAAELAASLADAPLSEAVKRDIVRIETSRQDYMPGLSAAEKADRLSRMSYRDYLLEVVKADPGVIPYYQTRTHGEWGLGIDAEPALDCWGAGHPGFQGLGLVRGKIPRMGNTAGGYASTDMSYFFRFPDGNATIARQLVRQLVPGVAPGSTVQDVILAKFDYAALDRPDAPVRLRLNSTVVNARHIGGGEEVEVTYMNGGRAHSVRGAVCILAGYNMMIPYIVPDLPEAQKDALHQLVKVPLVYTNVALRNWRAFDKLGVSSVSAPGSYFSSFSLIRPASIGGYTGPASPDDPAILFMLRTPNSPDAPTERDQHRAGRAELLGTPFDVFERNIRDLLTRALGAAGFDADRDIAAIAVNRWPHGYAYEYNPLYDPWDVPDSERPHVIGRRRFGRIAIANSDSGAAAYTDSAIDQAHRAVHELLAAGAPAAPERQRTPA
jgi:spermidine dehydrogenase